MVSLPKRFRWNVAQRLMEWSRKAPFLSSGVRCSSTRLITQGGRCVGFAIDQHTNDDAASEIEWLGRKAWILSSPARLARLAKVPIVPIRIIWREGMHVLQISAPIRIDLALDKGQDVNRLTNAYAKVSEDWIKDYPGQWLWLHRRWKKRESQDAAK